MRALALALAVLLLCSTLSGCAGPPDEDDDGVTDELDLCSLTPTEELVDDSGCSSSQRDVDGDSVSDADDLCAETPVDGIAD